ncbi:MAG: 30S ribosomal protein S6 [Bryobacteraceae bacterium]
MRVYEELFIVKPDAPEEEVDAYIGQLKELITNGKGTVEKADKWGTRKLAYRVSKYNEGVYVLFQFSSSPELVKEVERRMRVTDLVIKFITVRIDEKTKKIEKRKKQRDKRAARKPPPPPMASPMQPAAAPAMPAAPSLPAAPAMPVPASPAAVAPGTPESGATVAAGETKES